MNIILREITLRKTYKITVFFDFQVVIKNF